jgi:hypothetical protein
LLRKRNIIKEYIFIRKLRKVRKLRSKKRIIAIIIRFYKESKKEYVHVFIDELWTAKG